MHKDFFSGRSLLIVTKHGKEKVICPLLEKHLSVVVTVNKDFDTDQFGTFTSEIERPDPANTTLLKKLKAAMQKTGASLAVASEGSFGPHPNLPFIPADEEWVLLVDLDNKLELWGRQLSTETNYAQQEVEDWSSLQKFAEAALFPSHKIILKASDGAIIKDIDDWQLLKATACALWEQGLKLKAETDMRAMHNPTRMKVIEAATKRLVETATSYCPSCGKPGFAVTGLEPGLPCEQCGQPTIGVLKYVRTCEHCHYQQEQWYPRGEVSDAQYCEYCNP